MGVVGRSAQLRTPRYIRQSRGRSGAERSHLVVLGSRNKRWLAFARRDNFICPNAFTWNPLQQKNGREYSHPFLENLFVYQRDASSLRRLRYCMAIFTLTWPASVSKRRTIASVSSEPFSPSGEE